MLIIGTGGMAREVAGILEFDNPHNELYFFNNIDTEIHLMWNRYTTYHTEDELVQHFKNNGNLFICCIANPLIRQRLTERIEQLGGVKANAISYRADISHFADIDRGIVIQPGCVVASDVTLKTGVFLNALAVIGHDSILHPYVSVGPGAKILGNVEIGAHSYIGTNAVIMPGVKIGEKVRIGVGQIITEDVPSNSKIN